MLVVFVCTIGALVRLIILFIIFRFLDYYKKTLEPRRAEHTHPMIDWPC